ncbi:hypothetical protein Droror1_Dr00007520 [Drosera rotundifolia]
MLAPDKATIEEAIREGFVVGIVQAEVLERNRKELVEKFGQKQEEAEKEPIKENSTLVKYLEEKTLCDYQAQKEKDERCARVLDLEVSKWCDKKETCVHCFQHFILSR